MIKSFKILSFLSLFLFFFTSCVTVETQSKPMELNLKVEINYDKIIVQKHAGAGKYNDCEEKKANVYKLNIESMRGGYSEFLGIKFNKHNPREYKIVRIKNHGNMVKELSLKEIERLERDKEGNYHLKLD